jgi:hypothetical protein
MSREIASQGAHLFPPPAAVRWERRPPFHQKGAGQNPPPGASISYYLKDKPPGEVTLEILDAKGALVKKLSSKVEPPELEPDDPDGPGEPKKKTALSIEPGVQQVAWDLAYAGAEKIKGAKVEGDDPETGPTAVPGEYSVRLTVGGQVLTAPLDLRPDPRLGLTAADYAAQLELGQAVRDSITRLASRVRAIRSVVAQIEAKNAALEGNASAAAWLKASAEVIARCHALEGKLHNPEAQVEYDILARGSRLYTRLNFLFSVLKQGSGAPTQGMREVYAEQAGELDQIDAEWKALVSGDLAALGQKARELGGPEVLVPGS